MPNHEKIKKAATARNKNKLYRRNHASTGNEHLTECFLSSDEFTVKFSGLNEQYTRHEKIKPDIAALIKFNFYKQLY